MTLGSVIEAATRNVGPSPSRERYPTSRMFLVGQPEASRFETSENQDLPDGAARDWNCGRGMVDIQVPAVSERFFGASRFPADFPHLDVMSSRKQPATAVIPALGPLAQTYTPIHSGVETGDDNINLLATKWLKPQDLAVMVETQGLNHRKGKFSTAEQGLVQEAIQRYQEVCDFYVGSSRR